ncbi:hypothetical protein GCM10009827_118900 [Dactylosporangium maewongense]|uniref:Uncharacterized protein n=1 Tax=Dactylosporangium maewongense TaxID=634393 RepID=A0ABN2DHA9_9ACTN
MFGPGVDTVDGGPPQLVPVVGVEGVVHVAGGVAQFQAHVVAGYPTPRGVARRLPPGEWLDNDQAAVDRLLQRLANVATPAGPTPNQLRAEPGRQLPLTVLPPTSAPRESTASIDNL